MPDPVGQYRQKLYPVPGIWHSRLKIFRFHEKMFRERAHLKESADYLLPGMYISAQIQTGSSDTTTLPEKSIVRFEGKHYGFKYLGKTRKNDKSVHQFRMVEVIKGITENGITAIQLLDNEVAEADNFVIEGAFALLASAKNKEGEGH